MPILNNRFYIHFANLRPSDHNHIYACVCMHYRLFVYSSYDGEKKGHRPASPVFTVCESATTETEPDSIRSAKTII